MTPPTDSARMMSRRRFLHATAAVAPARRPPARAAVAAAPAADPDFGALDAKIQGGMAQYGIPGVAVGVLA
jgi:CubicO group peptidase (beta-lactamase class C family)